MSEAQITIRDTCNLQRLLNSTIMPHARITVSTDTGKLLVLVRFNDFFITILEEENVISIGPDKGGGLYARFDGMDHFMLFLEGYIEPDNVSASVVNFAKYFVII